MRAARRDERPGVLLTLGVVLMVTGVGPMVVAQLAWWLVTGTRLDP